MYIIYLDGLAFMPSAQDANFDCVAYLYTPNSP